MIPSYKISRVSENLKIVLRLKKFTITLSMV